jgi:hypothetical protein
MNDLQESPKTVTVSVGTAKHKYLCPVWIEKDGVNRV